MGRECGRKRRGGDRSGMGVLRKVRKIEAAGCGVTVPDSRGTLSPAQQDQRSQPRLRKYHIGSKAEATISASANG